MIKRQFFRDEHGDKDDQSSNSSSSSSDSEVEVEGQAESEDHSEGVELKEIDESSSSSGYESENSSADEINADSTGCTSEDDGSESDKQNTVSLQLSGKHGASVLKEEINGVAQKDSVPHEMPDCVMKFKSVYRCRLCPRIVCLTKETMRSHLNSKRHTRSEKLLKENRLKAMLNSDGEIENQETPAEMHARIVALAQNNSSKKKNKGRQRQKNRLRNKKDVPSIEKTKESTKRPAKKRRKNET
ncbi:uncharacterized protein [Euphorbia lathyris]|uniref:uncharacterized protein n=1 Tax=Euphorbia lathyris TaxID=212925 RepID=UPI0033144557